MYGLNHPEELCQDLTNFKYHAMKSAVKLIIINKIAQGDTYMRYGATFTRRKRRNGFRRFSDRIMRRLRRDLQGGCSGMERCEG